MHDVIGKTLKVAYIKGWSLPYAQCIRPRPGPQSDHGDTSYFSRSHGVTGHFWERSRGHRNISGSGLHKFNKRFLPFSGSAHLCHASEEHVRLSMRVGRVRQASALKRVRLGALSAHPAPLPITFMGRGKEQSSLCACFAAHEVSTRPSFYLIARVGLLDQVRG